jgi:TonB family protein
VAAIAAAPAAPLQLPASSAKSTAPEAPFVASKPTPAEKLSDDPVLADLERGEVGPPPTATSSPHEAGQAKSRSPLVALLVLALAGGGFYAGWMYQPGFRATVQAQVNRVLALAGVAAQQKAAPARQAPARIPAQTSVQPATAPAGAPSTLSPMDAPQPKGISAAADSSASAPAMAKPESRADSKKTEAASASADSALPGDHGAVILSSKGAEKRLVRQIPPALPEGAAARGLEGTVVLKTVVDDSGKVESVHLIEGNPTLGDAAIQAVKQWRYRPYVRDGKSLPFQTVVLVDFQRP